MSRNVGFLSSHPESKLNNSSFLLKNFSLKIQAFTGIEKACRLISSFQQRIQVVILCCDQKSLNRYEKDDEKNRVCSYDNFTFPGVHFYLYCLPVSAGTA
jgi:hypothetical protein